MKKHGSLSLSYRGRLATCGYCKGSGRDLSRSLWGEFVCPVCGGTGKQETKFEVRTWNQTYHVLLGLSKKIAGSGFAPHVIIGVSGGGSIPARILCDLLSVPFLAQVDACLGKRKGQLRLAQPVRVRVSGRKVLAVDEAADTGESLQSVKEHVTKEGAREVKTAAIYIKPWTDAEPDYYEKKTSRWVVFPWEVKRTVESIATSSDTEKRRELENLESAGMSARLTRRFLHEIDEDTCMNR